MFLLHLTSLTDRDLVALCLIVCWQFALLILDLSEFLRASKVTSNTPKHKHTAQRREEEMCCFVFSTVLNVLTVSDSTLRWKRSHAFSALTITIFHSDEAAEKMGLLWTFGSRWALEGKPFSNEEHSQGPETPQLIMTQELKYRYK